ncbi:N-acetylmuramic acid 6-phosphate etherase [Rhodopirellula sp. P2]|uniref:N-acetylmuramic acid 6-phosphate etherase n=1 Tax=Rhodopirellula sp. P2 TaxID=2127060 RepID=UPI0023680703|nr:N-acetylmuramic acid 6-phosphate etherase [Rhodopirellula sp. P2]WDQ18581.1 N-acetylmuramic acid 6-phosphate etherase [Rhodopirellula sp. P2]
MNPPRLTGAATLLYFDAISFVAVREITHAKPSTMLNQLTTEASNPASAQIDSLSALQIVQLINQQDALIAAAVNTQAERIAEAVDVIADKFRSNGRLVYLGAGTSGRLGVLDASECPPTFRTPPEMVVGVIAGGPEALTRAIEGAEDHPEFAKRDLAEIKLSDNDVLVGIATSGRTPYVIGGLQYARSVGAVTVGLSCNPNCQLRPLSQIMIAPVVGPEVVSGSTRLKAGTATKMVLNMLTTGAMIRIGKTYGNRMVDVRATNEKLVARSRQMLSEIVGIPIEQAEQLLHRCEGEVKTAIVVHMRDVSPQTARRQLAGVDGHLSRLRVSSPE